MLRDFYVVCYGENPLLCKRRNNYVQKENYDRPDKNGIPVQVPGRLCEMGMGATNARKGICHKTLYCMNGTAAKEQIKKEGSVLCASDLSEYVNYCFAVRTFNGVKHYTPIRATASTKTQRNWARQIRKFGTVESRTAADCMW